MMTDESSPKSPLVKLREKAGLTQESFARSLGVTDHTIRNWEKGRAEPKLTIKQWKKLCELLNCTVEELPNSFAPGGDRPGGDAI